MFLECRNLLELLHIHLSTDTKSNLSIIVDNDKIIKDEQTIVALVNLNISDNKVWKTTITLFYKSGLVIDIPNQLTLSKML